MTIEPVRYNACLLEPELLTAELSFDRSAQISASLLLAAKESKEATAAARREEGERLRASEDRQVEALHEQADDIRAAGYARGFSAAFSGGAKIVGAGLSLSGPESESHATLAEWNGYGEIASGAGSVVGGYYDGAARDAEADSVAAGHRAGESKRRLEDLKTAEQDARELGRAALDFRRETTRIQAQTDAATIYLRG